MKKAEYWVIDTERPGIDHGSHTAAGPFSTQAAAERYLVQDSENLLHGTRYEDLNDLDPATYAAPVHIVKVVRTVRQTPQIKIAVKLVDVKEAARAMTRGPKSFGRRRRHEP